MHIVRNEQLVLLSIINNPDLLFKIDEEDLINKPSLSIFRAIKYLHSEEIPLHKSNLFIESNKLDSSITEEMINNLLDLSYDVNSFDYYLENLRKDKAKHELSKEIFNNLDKEAFKKGEFDLSQVNIIIDKVKYYINKIENKHDILYTLDDMFNIYGEEINRRIAGNNFYTTGDPYLDENLLIGFAPCYITIIFSATGMGKSSFVLYLKNKQIDKNIPCVYISTENDVILTMDRLVAMRKEIPISHLYFKNADSRENYQSILGLIEEEKELLKSNDKFFFVEEAGLNLNNVEDIVVESKKRMKTDYLVCSIDLLTMLTDFDEKDDSKANVYERGINKLHNIAKKHSVHFVGVVQANRETDNIRLKKIADIDKLKPTRNSIKNSGALGERARQIISIFRKKYYADTYFPDDPETDIMEDIAELNILKQNMWKPSYLNYLYNADICRFYKYEKEENN